MKTLKEALELTIIEEWQSATPRLVLADLCEEQGEDNLACAYRHLADRKPDHAHAQNNDGKSWDWWMHTDGSSFDRRALPYQVFTELPRGSGPQNGRTDFKEYKTAEQAMAALLYAIPLAVNKGWKPS